MKDSRIVADGGRRLWKAIESDVRRDFAKEQTTAKGFWARMAVEKKIWNEVKKRMQSVASPHSLYSSMTIRDSEVFWKPRLPWGST